MLGFPDSDIDLQVEAAFGADLTADPSTWEFTDLTVDGSGATRLLGNPITIRRGTTAGGANQQTTTCNGLQLLNNDGWLTPHHAGSPYWPYVDAGTPIRVGVRYLNPIVDTFTRTVSNGWGTAESGHVWEPTPGSESAFSVASGQAKITFPAVNVSRAVRTFHPFRDVDVTFDASMTAVQTGVASIVGPQLRRAGGGLTMLYCTVEFNTGGTITLRVRRNLNSTSADTLANTVVPALTYSGGTVIRVRVRVVGTSLRMRAWLASGSEPSTWPVDITQTDVLEPGDSIGMQASVFSGNTNTLPNVFTIDNLRIDQVHTPRVEGYITDVRPVFLPQADGTWSTVAIEIGGVGSRLEKNQAPAASPMRRSIQASVLPYASDPPIAYWPLEDAEGALSGASAFPGVAPMTVTGPAVFSFDQGTPEDLYQATYGTKPLVSVAAGARLHGIVPTSSVSTQWSVMAHAQLFAPDVPGVTELPIMEWSTPTGSWNRWRLIATTTGYIVRAHDDPNLTQTNVITYVGASSRLTVFEVDAQQSGGNINVSLLANSGLLGSATIAGTVGPVTRIAMNPDRWNTTASLTPKGLKFIVGHVRVHDTTAPSGVPYYYDSDQAAALTLIWAHGAWFREAAHRRVERLCAEEHVPCQILGDPYSTGITVLNAQRDGAFTDLVSQAAESESGGLLYEWAFGYRYLARTQRYNQAPALTIDLSTYCRSVDTDQGDVLVPQLESRAANYWTVKRHLGSEGSAAADPAFRARRGTIGQEAIVDVLTDDVLNDHAVWRVWVNTGGRDAHYPAIPLDLAANPGYIDAWTQTDIGSRVWRTNQPTVAGVNTIDQIVEGITETIGSRTWSASMDASPGAVWDVWTPGDPVLGWVNPPASTLQGPHSSTATSLLVTTLSPIKWSTDPAAYPIDVELAGERVTFNNPPTGSGPVFTFTGVTRSVNGIVKAHASGTPVTLWTPPVIGL